MLLLRSRQRLVMATLLSGRRLYLLDLAAGIEPALEAAEIAHIAVSHFLQRLADQRRASAGRAIGHHRLGPIEGLVVQRGGRIGAEFDKPSRDRDGSWNLS